MADATELSRWMALWNVTASHLAREIGMNREYVGDLAAGSAWPSDKTKIAIAHATREHERARGVVEPVGVPADTWIRALEARSPAVANGRG